MAKCGRCCISNESGQLRERERAIVCVCVCVCEAIENCIALYSSSIERMKIGIRAQ